MARFNGISGCLMAEAIILLLMFLSTLFMITTCSQKEIIKTCEDSKTDTVVADSIK